MRSARGLLYWLAAAWAHFFPDPEPPRTSVRSGWDAHPLFEQVARRLGFSRLEEGPMTRLYGRRGRLEMRVEVIRIPWPNGQVRFVQRMIVRAPRAFSPGKLHFEPRTRGSPPGVVTRDPAFDRDMVVLGEERAAIVLLSSSARATIVGNGGTWSIDGPSLEWRAQRAPNFLGSTIEQVLDLAEGFLEAVTDPLLALEQRVRYDPIPQVRRKALALVLTHHPSGPRQVEIARAALADRLPLLRLEAAAALGEEGYRTLLELLVHPATAWPIRLAAARKLPVGDPNLREALCQLLERPEVELRVAALDVLGRVGGSEALALVEPHTRGSTGRVRRAANEAYARVLARNAHLEAGQLSVVSGPSLGAVSPAEPKRHPSRKGYPDVG